MKGEGKTDCRRKRRRDRGQRKEREIKHGHMTDGKIHRHRQTVSQTDRQTDSQTDRQPNRQTDKQPAKQTDRLTAKQTDRQTDRQPNRQTAKQTDRQTDRQTASQTDRQTDRPVTVVLSAAKADIHPVLADIHDVPDLHALR